MKGTEDIGGGYKVNFRLQGVFNSGNGKLGLADTTGGYRGVQPADDGRPLRTVRHVRRRTAVSRR